MSAFFQDLRYTLRGFRRQPGFALVAVLALGLGIGANTAIFSLVRSVILEPLPYHQPDRLVMFWERGSESDVTWLSERELLEYREATSSFDGIAAYDVTSTTLTDGVGPERIETGEVTGNAFSVLGVPALHGRTIAVTDDVPGRDDVVVLSHGLWQRRFGGATGVIGEEVRVDGRPRRVIGIMPPGFRLPLDYRSDRPTELWVPLAIDPAGALPWGDRGEFLFARLKAGVSPERATADLAAAMGGWVRSGQLEQPARDRAAVPFAELLLGSVRPILLILWGAVGLILLIACANVANLLLARSDARRQEVAVRTALGAGRSRLARQLLVESGALALLGTLVGVALAYGGLKGLLAITPENVIRHRAPSLDLAVLAYTACVALVSTLLAGLVPALRLSRTSGRSLVGGGGRGDATSVRKKSRQLLVAGQAALAVVLVIGAGLLGRSFAALRAIDPGFEPSGVLTARLTLPPVDYPQADDLVAFYGQLVDRASELPGVESAGATRILPLTRTIGDWSITIEGRPSRPEENPNADWQVVTPGYFETLGIDLLAGRTLSPDDHDGSLPVAVVNETMARRYWPGEEALGKRFHLGTADQPWVTIVGIAPGVRHNAVVEEPRAEMYLPHSQFALQAGGTTRGMTLVLKTAGPPLSVVPALRELVASMNPNLPLSEVRTLEEVTDQALAEPRFSAFLFGIFGALALLLAAVGLYGVLAYFVARRTREIGIRMAVGADRLSVSRLVLAEGLLVAGSGIAAGVVASLAATRLLTGQLYGVKPADPATFTAVTLLLLAVAALASYLPARRAAAVSPVRALRRE